LMLWLIALLLHQHLLRLQLVVVVMINMMIRHRLLRLHIRRLVVPHAHVLSCRTVRWVRFVSFRFVSFRFVGLVWFGLVWFGLVWFGLVWFGLVWLIIINFARAHTMRHMYNNICSFYRFHSYFLAINFSTPSNH
jgi:hypothetical protein